MSFRKYGGLDKAATNNIVRSHYSNSDNPTISELLGQPNSKIVSQSHLDFSGNSVLNLGTLYFIDGTFINTAGPLQPLNPSPAGSYQAPYAITLNNFGNITSIATQTDMGLIGFLSVNSAISGIYPLNVNGDINISGKYLVNGSELEINNVWLISTLNPNNIYYSNGTVGIGGDPSSSPYNLYVNGSVGITSTLNVSGTSTLGTINTGTATINGAATINGTSKITGATTMNSTLQVDGVTRLGLSGNSTQTFINGPLNINNTSAISGMKLYYDTNSYIQSLSNLYFTNINNTSTWMTITSSGLVGIGNPSPSYNLDVVGSAGLRVANGNSSSLGSIYLGNPADQYASLSTDGTSNMNIKNNQNGAINWTTSGLGSSYLTLTSSGILKINNPPAYPSITNLRLNVNGDINFEGLVYQDGIAVDFNPLWISVPDSNNIYYDPESVGSGNGTVGIGLTSPNSLYKLDVAGAIHVSNNLYVDGVILNSITANPVNINNNLYVTTNNVGIGINPSAYKLDVNGIIHTNNNLLVDGSATVGTTTSTSTNLLSVNGSTQINFDLNVNNNAVIGVTNGTTSNLKIWGSLNVITNTTLGRKNTTSHTNIYGPNSTDTISGALVVTGGVGISEDTYIGGLTRLTNTTPSTSTTNGALTVTGGVGIGGALNVGGNTILGTTNTNSTTIRGNLNMNDTNSRGIIFANGTQTNAYLGGTSQWLNGTTSGTNTPIFYTAGNVGIGTTTPSFVLDVSGNARIGNVGGSLTIGQFNNSTAAGAIGGQLFFGATRDDGEQPTIVNRQYGGTDVSELVIFKPNDPNPTAFGPDRIRLRGGAIAFDTYPSASDSFVAENIRMFIDRLGNVGIGTVDPSFNFDVSGNVRITGNCRATSYTTTSDYRIKENVRNLDDTYNIDDLKPVTYLNTQSEKQDIGLIAHEVQEVFPFLVTGEKDDQVMQGINYNGFIPILIKEIQDLKRTIIELKKSLSQ